MAEHSPLPWSRGQYAGTAGIDDADGSSVADAVTDEDAELILRAVNGRPDLIDVLNRFLWLGLNFDDRMHPLWIERFRAAFREAEAVATRIRREEADEVAPTPPA
jgi:hypothetical protein